MDRKKWGVHYFKHPTSGEAIQMTSGFSWLWLLLFGFFYFGYKGMWGQAFIAFGLALVTVGISWWVYPFFTYRIVKRHYRLNGWLEVDENGKTLSE